MQCSDLACTAMAATVKVVAIACIKGTADAGAAMAATGTVVAIACAKKL